MALSAIYAQLKSSNRDKIFLQTIKLMQMKEKYYKLNRMYLFSSKCDKRLFSAK